MSLENSIIIGAGPSGMACAYTLAEANRPSLVLEKDEAPGGLSRTIKFNDYLFDIGGHRFFSKSEEINRFWHTVMDGEMLQVRRLSRIYYRNKYFNYPLSFMNTFKNLGMAESLLCIADYLKCRYFTTNDDTTFEGWTINRFGERLFDIFFKDFTEKVWNVSCRYISADWAKQRLRGMSLKVAVQRAILGKGQAGPKTLCNEFLYPKLGPGDFYRRLEALSEAKGTQFTFYKTVIRLKHDGQRVTSIKIKDTRTGKEEELPVSYLFSSMPLPVLVGSLEPLPPKDILEAAGNLHFRSFLTVNIILDREHLFPDQWLYINSSAVKLGRVQNYKNWSPFMTADPTKTSLGLEYFCTEGDELWKMDDTELIRYALAELEKVGIASGKYYIDGFVSRHANAYPVYSLDYRKHVDAIRRYLERFDNLQTMGRSGLFRYDNSDHALLTGIYAARNFLKEGHYDIWNMNADEGYLES